MHDLERITYNSFHAQRTRSFSFIIPIVLLWQERLFAMKTMSEYLLTFGIPSYRGCFLSKPCNKGISLPWKKYHTLTPLQAWRYVALSDANMVCVDQPNAKFWTVFPRGLRLSCALRIRKEWEKRQ